MVDPAIQQLLDTVFVTAPDPNAPDVAQLRAGAERSAVLGGVPEPLHDVRDLVAAGARGQRVPMRMYRPASDPALPLVVYAHGGGWVTGSLDSHDRLCRQLANRLGAAVLAVDYACAPEQRYPAALDDVDAAWHWCREEARALGVDPSRMAVAGDSSGGNLAAALTLRLRRRREAQPVLQLLLYPALDVRTTGDAFARYAEGFNLSAAMMRWYWRAYAPDGRPDDGELSPLAAADLSGLAPAVVLVAAVDVLRDDGLAYARRLAESGVPVEVVDCPGMIHGFLRWSEAVPAVRSHIDRVCELARRRLAPLDRPRL